MKIQRIVLLTILFTLVVIWFFCFIPWHLINNHQFISWDAFGYNSYLPSFFIYHDFNPTHWVNQALMPYPYIDAAGYVDVNSKHDLVTKYPIGVALLQTPFFLLSYLFAWLFHFRIDGYSLPFQWGNYLSGLFYFFVGLRYSYLFISQFIDKYIAKLSLGAVFFGSIFFYWSVMFDNMSHVYGWSCISVLLFFSTQLKYQQSFRNYFFTAFPIVMAVLCRTTNAIILIPVVILLFDSLKNIFSKQNLIKILLCLVLCLIPVFLQMMYWKAAGNKWILNVYMISEEWFDFQHPNIYLGLLDKERGWWIHAPIAALCYLSSIFLIIKNRKIGIGFLVFQLVWTYVIFSWYAWDYAGGMTSRAMVETSTVLALMLGAGMEYFQNRWIKKAGIFFIAFCITYNMLQNWLSINNVYQNGFPNDWNLKTIAATYRTIFNAENKFEGKHHLKQNLIESQKVLFDSTYKFSDSIFLNNKPQVYKSFKTVLETTPAKSFITAGNGIRITGSGFYECKNPWLKNQALFAISIDDTCNKNYYWQADEMPINTFDTNKVAPRQSMNFQFDFIVEHIKSNDDKIHFYFWNRGLVNYWITNVRIKKLKLK